MQQCYRCSKSPWHMLRCDAAASVPRQLETKVWELQRRAAWSGFLHNNTSKVSIKKKRQPLHFKSILNCERQHDGEIEFLMRKKNLMSSDTEHTTPQKNSCTGVCSHLSSTWITQPVYIWRVIQSGTDNQIDGKSKYGSGQNLNGSSNPNKGKQVVLVTMKIQREI